VTAEVTAGLPGSRMRVYQERFQWKPGIALKDWRYVVRICNIDVSDTDAANVKTIINNMETALETPPNRLGKPVFYMNRTMRRLLRREARESVGSGGGLTYENFDGKRILMFGDARAPGRPAPRPEALAPPNGASHTRRTRMYIAARVASAQRLLRPRASRSVRSTSAAWDGDTPPASRHRMSRWGSSW
jgi:hypothetical protein